MFHTVFLKFMNSYISDYFILFRIARKVICIFVSVYFYLSVCTCCAHYKACGSGNHCKPVTCRRVGQCPRLTVTRTLYETFSCQLIDPKGVRPSHYCTDRAKGDECCSELDFDRQHTVCRPCGPPRQDSDPDKHALTQCNL